MSNRTPPQLHLSTSWTRGTNGSTPTYELSLTNLSDEALTNFTMGISGPSRIDDSAILEGAEVVRWLSNFSELRPPSGVVLGPSQTWTVRATNLIWPLRHWTDGVQGAYVVLDGGTIVDVMVSPTTMTGYDIPLRRGGEVNVVPQPAPTPIAVVPWPNRVVVSGQRELPAGFALEANEGPAVAAADAFRALTRQLFPAEGMVRAVAEGGMPIRLRIEGGFRDEAYRIDFASADNESVTVSAGTTTGLLYGLVTLGQIWRGARHYPQTFTFPLTGAIIDQPAMGWRGLHLDVARQFYATPEVTQLLAIAAWNKLNRFHMHLSDDEAWRIEIDAYPELTQIGAWRGHNLSIPPLLGSSALPSGGYYSKDAIREIVATAAQFGIEVVPEIDIPAHNFAMLQSLPQLRDPNEAGTYFSVQGFPNNCLNPALDETYKVVETVLRELIELFPFKTIHIGADEVPLGAWSGSPIALTKLRELAGDQVADDHAKRSNVTTHAHGADDIGGSGAAVLQAMFIKRVHEFLAAQGCTTGGWEEAAHGNVIDKRTSYLCGWRSVEVCADLAGQGYQMVVCPGQVYYLDMAIGREWAEPGGSWAGWTDTEKLYRFDPLEGWTDAQRQNFRGVQACIWSESMKDRAVFDRLVFPRVSALAETGWTGPAHKSWDRFNALAGLMPTLCGSR